MKTVLFSKISKGKLLLHLLLAFVMVLVSVCSFGCEQIGADNGTQGGTVEQPTDPTPEQPDGPTDPTPGNPDPGEPENPTPEEPEPGEPTDPTPEEPSKEKHVQELNYAESTDTIANPDQGFYTPVNVTMTESGANYPSWVIADGQLYHLRVDISAFSSAVNGTEDKEFTATALAGVEAILKTLAAKEKNAIFRMAYDAGFAGNVNREASVAMMCRHIEQMCAVLNKYETVLTAVEVGMVGPWGEMHTSTAANPETIKKLTEAYLSHTENLPVLVRTPKMIYDYLGITTDDIDIYTISPSSDSYRLGMYNDGYLGSDTDLGTYTYDRQKEIAFVAKQTAHLPYGGEVVAPESTLHDIDVCVPEMFAIHLSYLNIQWNNTVVDKWKKTNYTAASGNDTLYHGLSAFTYIENHMGYRLVLRKSTLAYTSEFDTMDVSLQIDNVGFGNLTKSKYAALQFVGANGKIVSTKKVGMYAGENNVTFSDVDISKLAAGEYIVYLRLSGDASSSAYAVRFANDAANWHTSFKSNLIGKITVER